MAFDAALKKTGQSARKDIAGISPIVLRVALILLFFAYLVEFVVTLFAWGQIILPVLLAALALALGFLVVKAAIGTGAEYHGIDDQTPVPPSPMGRYFGMFLLPVGAVLISTICNVRYTTPLLRFTQNIFEVLAL